MTTIPASLFVNVQPNVLSGSGDGLDLIGLDLTTSTRVPIGSVYSFPNGAAVAAFFGAASAEAKAASGGVSGAGISLGSGYFGGFNNSNKTPGAMLFAQYNTSPLAAYLWGGNFGAANTIAQMQALSGSLTVVIDGYSHVIGSISLASYNSYSTAAAAIQAAFTDPTEASFTASIGASFTGSGSGTTLTASSVTGLISVGDSVSGTGVPANTKITALGTGTGGAGTYITNNATTSSSNAITSTSNVLDVTVCASPTIAIGQTVTGSGVAAGTLITALGTGTGGVGTYVISGAQQNTASESMTGVATAPTVTYDSVSGAFVVTSGITGAPSLAAFATGTLAAPLLLTAATGAVLSQGAATAVPGTFMTALTQVTQNWASFFTNFDPDGGSGNTQKQAFAAWTNSQNNRYAYLAWDTDITPTQSVPASSSLGYVLQQSGSSGTVPIYEPSDYGYASALAGWIASVDFEETNGRTTMAYRTQTGLTASVTTAAAAVNLGGSPLVEGSFGNGYNYVGAIATANQGFVNFQRGTISGPYKWIDSYINQIWMNNNFQLTLVELLQNTPSLPYTQDGYSIVESALADDINAALNFGAINTGVPLSSSEIQEVNQAAGTPIDGILSTRGWYLQILPASSGVRQSRGTPPMKFWYTDGGSIQAINLAAIAVQ